MTTIYLALGGLGEMAERRRAVYSGVAKSPYPSILVSYVYFEPYRNLFAGNEGWAGEWFLDSGAFTAANAGTTIDLGQYIDFCHEVMASPIPPSAIFALDSINDYRQSEKNTEAMWKAGIEAVPCYHVGEPAEVLRHMCAAYPRIAVGGTVGLSTAARMRAFDSVFATAWPKRIHGFGVNTERVLSRFPFDSGDSTSWIYGPLAYGQWPGVDLTTSWLRNGHNLRPVVDHYLEIERRLKTKWGAVLRRVR
jgi:hypothetical protein